MVLTDLTLLHFKNYEELSIQLNSNINCFVGVNGSGKTNVLDAIQCMALTRSAFISTDAQLIKHDEFFFMVKGVLQENEEIVLSLKRGEKKALKVNGKVYDRLIDHIGNYPIVFITPNDTDLIREGSEVRRKFFDLIISQLDREYMLSLVKYNKLLKQRNALLKELKLYPKTDKDLLYTFDAQLMPLNDEIYNKRNAFLTQFLPYFQTAHNHLSLERDKVAFVYRSQLSNEHFKKDFKDAFQKDMVLERTTMGIHRDDYLFQINNHPIKKFGSQGQQKSYMIALQLAKYKILHQETGKHPFLLLDDIFDKLDEDRIKQLLTLVNSNEFGQIFITDASKSRTERIVKQIKGEYCIFEVDHGNIKKLV